jgi:hypothetical protein
MSKSNLRRRTLLIAKKNSFLFKCPTLLIISTDAELRPFDVNALSVSKYLASSLLSVLSFSLPFPVYLRVGVSASF